MRTGIHLVPALLTIFSLPASVQAESAVCDTPQHHQFDFWVGEWQVVPTAGGLPQGASHIEKELGDCVIWENWKSLGNPYAGKSYNVYNTSLKRWE